MSLTSPPPASAPPPSLGAAAVSYPPSGPALPTKRQDEHSIPIRTGDLTRLILAAAELEPAERMKLSVLAKRLGSRLHANFYDWLAELKELYAPLDPDSDCIAPDGCGAPPHERAAEAFLEPFELALHRAKYTRIDLAVLSRAVAAPNELGLSYEPDFSMFDHLRVYVRGRGRVAREVRNIHTMFRRRTYSFEAYRRVVIALKFKPGSQLDEYVRPDRFYLRMFKDVPYVNMDMHLPEHVTKVRMRWIDRLQIASPVMTGIPSLVAKYIFAVTISPLLLAGLVVAPISAGVRSFLGYQTAKKHYLLRMIRHLYYLTLANNASVINRLVDSAEEEEFKEALLAYVLLWRGRSEREPWDQARLDARVEAYLRERAGVDIDFEIGEALEKLFRLGLVRRVSSRYLHAIPIDQALHRLGPPAEPPLPAAHP